MYEEQEQKNEIDRVINTLESKGIHHNDEYKGLGDVIEDTLNKLGITQERFKSFFNLQECDCNNRKKWLNSLFKKHKDNL